MSVASTKAFYAQVAAGLLLAYAIADVVPGGAPLLPRRGAGTARGAPRPPGPVAGDARDPPAIARRGADASPRAAATGRSSATASNQIAAREMRIKLSELCYKSIACDATEDKKHIDLSSEPMILVCAAGLVGSTADDVAKEVAIFRAHKAAPIVIASEGGRAFTRRARRCSASPTPHPRLAFVLATMVGHLFGYEAALAIDAQARPLREARAAIDVAITDRGGDSAERPGAPARASCAGCGRRSPTQSATYFDGVRSGAYNGHLEANTAVRLAGQFRYAHRHQPARRLPAGVRQGRHAGCGARRPHAGLERRRSTSSPVRSTPSSTRPRRSRSGSRRSDESLLHVPLVAGVARSRVAPRPPHLLDPQVARRARPGRGRDRRIDQVRGRSRRRPGPGDDRGRRSGRRVGRPPVAGGPRPAAAGHQGPGRPRAGADGRPRPQRRPARRDRARDQGRRRRPASSCSTSGWRTACRPGRRGRCCRATAAGTRR